MLQNSTFAEVCILIIPGSIFHDLGSPLRPISWYSWYLNLLFGMLDGFTVASWGTLGRSWDIGERREGHFDAQAWMFMIFGRFGDLILKVFWVPWINTCVCCYACFQVSFFSIGFWV